MIESYKYIASEVDDDPSKFKVTTDKGTEFIVIKDDINKEISC